MKKYDYVIVGSGLFAGVFAKSAIEHNKRCLVVEKRHTLGGNLYCEEIEGIQVHKYGAHIFHTSNRKVPQILFEGHIMYKEVHKKFPDRDLAYL